MEQTDSRPGYLLKLDRALTHLNSFDALIERWKKSDPYGAVEEIDPKTGEYVLRVRVASQPRPELGLLVGDSIHNMRSALDHLAFELASKFTDPLPDNLAKRSEFPIFNRRSKFMERKKNGDPAPGSGLIKIEAIDPAAQAVIETMQPYRGGDWLWLMLLHELDRVDKHRRLNLAVAASAEFSVTANKLKQITVHAPGPVEDGDELLRVPFDPKKDPRPQGTASFQVGFGEGQGPGERAWVLYNLRKIEGLIREKVVPALARFL